MRSAILEKGEKHYTRMLKVFQSIENRQMDYNWLITNCECYSKNKKINDLFSQEYIWITGEQLTEIISKEDFQFIWGVFSGFTKEFALEDLSVQNTRHNSQIAHIQELLIIELIRRNMEVSEKTLHIKYTVWRNLYANDILYVSDGDISKCICDTLNKIS